jgi:hypothetical protein
MQGCPLEVVAHAVLVLIAGQAQALQWLEDLEVDLGPSLDLYRDEDGSIKPRWRAYLYLRYVAIEGREDFDTITGAITLRDEAVKEAEENFQ